MQVALRLSVQQRAYGEVLWQDMQTRYGETDNPDYWRQRMQRRAYQGAIIEHLLGAARSLAQAILKQQAETRFVDTGALALCDISSLLQEQDYLSSTAQGLLSALLEGHMGQLQTAQKVFAKGVSGQSSTAGADEGQTIGLLASDNLEEPDNWPIGQWLRDLKELQESTQAELLEY